MAEERLQRRLAAILAADVAGHSRLMGANETGTLDHLRRCRSIVDGLIAAHHGRVVGSAGDSVLAEFQSSVDAVECARRFQDALGEFNATLSEAERMEYRVSINLGDVLVAGQQIYGDGVNVAARLEGLTEQGGVAVSASIHEQVHGKIDCAFGDLGLYRVKNIADPVRVYNVRGETERARKRWHPKHHSRLAGWQWATLGAMCLIAAEIGFYGSWKAFEAIWWADAIAIEALAVTTPPKSPSAGTTFRSCRACPEMTVVPRGTFEMGTTPGDIGHASTEGPPHSVHFSRAFTIGRYETTFAEWDACVDARGGDVPPDVEKGEVGIV